MAKTNKNFYKSLVVAFALFAMPANGMAQTVVKGTVVSRATGEGFGGARITLIGSGATAMSDENGCFEIKADRTDGVLRIEAPAHDMQIVGLRGRTSLRISLVKTTSEPYYDASSLSADEAAGTRRTGLTSMSAADDIDNVLRGSVYGNMHSGLGGGGAAVFVQGLHSINMSAQPLYVVDGLLWQGQDGMRSLHDGYFSNPLALIAPADIESITVLKNGQALYGAKGANGVVLIETKRSHNMATEITLNMSAGIKSPFKAVPMMDASEYRLYASDIMSGMKNIGDMLKTYDFLNDDPARQGYASSHNNTNWLKEINKTAFVQNYDVSVRGGDDVALYAFSLGYGRNDGNIDNTDFDRLNVRFNSDINLTKHFTTRADVAFTQVTRNVFDDGMNLYSSPAYLAYIKSPLYSPRQFDSTGRLFDAISDKDELGVGNPLAVTTNGEGKTKNYRFTASLAPKYQFTNCFSLSALVGFAWDKIKESSFSPDFGLAEQELYNDQNDWYGTALNSVASMMMRHSTLTADMHADWNILSGHHNIDLLGGLRFINDTFESDYGQGYNTGSDNLKSLSVTNAQLRTVGGTGEDWRSMAWYLNADYNYMHRYFLSASASMESNSRFGKHARGALRLGGTSWGLFPSVRAAWVVSNERFWKNVSFVDFLKLHASFDMSGNDDLPSAVTRAYFESVPFVGLAKGLAIANVGNDRLKWETVSTLSFGFDANLFAGILQVGANVFSSVTNNLLVSKQLPEEFGLARYYANDGRLSNRGFDVSLRARLVDSRFWRLSAGASVGHYKNELKRLAGGSFTTDILGGEELTATGRPLGVFYGFKTLGVFATKADADAAGLSIVDATGRNIAFGAGDVWFADTDGNKVIDDADKQVIGNPNPDFYGNFSLDLAWKRLSLSALFTYTYGNDAYNALRATLESGSSLHNQTRNMLNRWVADGQQTNVPRATYGDPMGNARFSDRWIEDASFLKLRSLSLSYELPSFASFVRGAKLWIAIDNVFTITKYLGADPEFSYGGSTLYQGIDAGLVPPTRSFHIGLRLSL